MTQLAKTTLFARGAQPAEAKLMSEKAPQATFSNELGPAHGNREAHVDDTGQPDLSVHCGRPSRGAH